ncbi:MAG: DUF2867 domain-containing protein [Bacteroidales bacterium]
MITAKSTVPNLSVLNEGKEQFNYVDSFRSQFFTNKQNIEIDKIIELFLLSGPKWADGLLAVRDRIVKVFGLKTSKELAGEQTTSCTNYEPGERLGLFKLFSKTGNEAILGEDDKHLNFRVSLLIEPSPELDKWQISITTVVKYNNWFGKLYFFPVKPFHRLIVKSTLKDMVRQL